MTLACHNGSQIALNCYQLSVLPVASKHTKRTVSLIDAHPKSNLQRSSQQQNFEEG
jgi:hypothetical protein